MSQVFYKILFVLSFVFFLTVIFTFSAHAEVKPIRVRDAGGKCGVYLRTLAKKQWFSDLSETGITEAIQKHGDKLLKEDVENGRYELVVLGPSEMTDPLVRFVEQKVSKAAKVSALRHGLYVSSLEKPSSGVWVADLEANAIEEYFKSKPDLSNSQVYLVGLSIYGADRKEFVKFTNELASEAGKPNLKITAISSPANLGEEMRMFFPMKEDWQKPTLGELAVSLPFYAISNTTFGVITAITQPASVAIPVITVNALQSASMTIPRQFWGNFFGRGRNEYEKWGRQILISAIFTVGLKMASDYGVGGFQQMGSTMLTVAGLWALIQSSWVKALFQSGWRMPVESGIPDWVAQETRKGNEKQARTAGTVYRQIATNIATPAWGYSTLTKSYLFEFLKKWTWGDVIMAAVGGTFAVANRYPSLYGVPIKVKNWLAKNLQEEDDSQKPKMQMRSNF